MMNVMKKLETNSKLASQCNVPVFQIHRNNQLKEAKKHSSIRDIFKNHSEVIEHLFF